MNKRMNESEGEGKEKGGERGVWNGRKNGESESFILLGELCEERRKEKRRREKRREGWSISTCSLSLSVILIQISCMPHADIVNKLLSPIDWACPAKHFFSIWHLSHNIRGSLRRVFHVSSACSHPHTHTARHRLLPFWDNPPLNARFCRSPSARV